MVKSVVKAFEVLRAFDNGVRSLSIGQLSVRLGEPKSSVHRLVSTLEQLGLLMRGYEDGKYRLGPGVLRLASAALEGLELRRTARHHLERLAETLEETVHLAILDKGEVVYIDKIDSPRGVGMVSHIGGRAPAHCTALGKAMLAYLPENEVREIAARGLSAYTPATITNVEELLAHLRLARARGYAVDQGEHESVICCVASPVRDYQGQVIGAISATRVMSGSAPFHMESMVTRVLEATAAASRDMGWGGERQEDTLQGDGRGTG